jgi:YfiH family protein
MNLGTQVGDLAQHVSENRARLRAMLPARPCWLRQVHGVRVIDAGDLAGAGADEAPEADACVAHAPQQVCAVLVADCLPVLLCDRAGRVVAAAHAGWRGLAGGVLERTLAAMGCAPEQLLAWLGPAIGPRAFEVGRDVVDAFTASDAGAAACFRPLRVPESETGPGNGPAMPRTAAEPSAEPKWLADLFALARRRLARAGVHAVFGGGLCTYSDARRFYSHRRDRRTGRQAALIWLQT